MANILLISPTSVGYGKKHKRRVFLYPPIGLCYIASILRNSGHKVLMLDVSLIIESEVTGIMRNMMLNNSIDFVGITATTPQIEEAFDILSIVKEVNKKCLTIVGGPHVSAMPMHVLNNKYVDIIVMGEGEETIADLFSNINNLKEVNGIGFKSNGSTVINKARPLIKDLNSVPYPAYDLLDMKQYGDVFLGRGLGVSGSRGCPYSCSFCSKSVFGNEIRLRSSENFINELIHWKNNYNVQNFFFQDEVFSIDKNRATDICERIIKSNLNIKWLCSTRANLLTKDLMRLMRDAGCINLGIGVESADKKILEHCTKKVTLEDIQRVVKWANELKITCQGFFIIGLPYETKDSIKRTIDFSRKVGFDYVSFSTLIPLPNTKIWDMAERGELIRWKNKDFTAFGKYSDPVIETADLTTEELKYYFKLAYRKFYFDPKYILRRIIALRPRTFIKDISSIFKIVKFMR